MKLETFEMDRFKRLNEEVLDDETNPSLIDVCTALLKELEGTMIKFSVVAKQRGFKYEVKSKKGSTLDEVENGQNELEEINASSKMVSSATSLN